MAPKPCSLQVVVRKTEDNTPDIVDDPEVDHEFEYGYLQIDNFRSYKRNSAEPKVKRWVALPRGTRVQTYSCSMGCDAFDAEHSIVARQPPFSGLKQQKEALVDEADWDTRSTASTTASSSDNRRVHFSDGILPGCWEDSDSQDLSMQTQDQMSSSLAEWIFIDRDICGFSLHEYAPHEAAVEDFASSPYACMFLEELNEITFQNRYRQRLSAESEDHDDRHEERRLDKALLMAGVRVNLIHAAAEETQEVIYEMSI